MTQEEKDLLLRDLCARLPYGVKAQYYGCEEKMLLVDVIDAIHTQPSVEIEIGQYGLEIEDVKPYLRPMSSMTEEEKREFYDCVTFEHTDGFAIDECCGSNQMLEKFDWLNAHHFDYRGLIQRGLALSTDKFNPYKD